MAGYGGAHSRPCFDASLVIRTLGMGQGRENEELKDGDVGGEFGDEGIEHVRASSASESCLAV
jgi:hypothetical protein